MKKAFIHSCFVALMVMAVACNETPVVHDLTERDANEIIVLLSKNDIKASKQKEIVNQEVFWVITVSAGDQMKAQGILVANNLPRVRQGGLKGICENTDMIVTEETEKCRLLLGYKGEIINSLESIPGVVSADVVLNIPDQKDFTDENTPVARPTAAVTIKYLTDANVKTALTEGKIQEFVANSITGLDARDVAVIISFLEQKSDGKTTDKQGPDKQGQTPSTDVSVTTAAQQNQNMVNIGGIVLDQTSARKLKVIGGIFLGLLLLLTAAFIYALLRMSRLRKQGSVQAEPASDSQDKELPQA